MEWREIKNKEIKNILSQCPKYLMLEGTINVTQESRDGGKCCGQDTQMNASKKVCASRKQHLSPFWQNVLLTIHLSMQVLFHALLGCEMEYIHCYTLSCIILQLGLVITTLSKLSPRFEHCACTTSLNQLIVALNVMITMPT